MACQNVKKAHTRTKTWQYFEFKKGTDQLSIVSVVVMNTPDHNYKADPLFPYCIANKKKHLLSFKNN